MDLIAACLSTFILDVRFGVSIPISIDSSFTSDRDDAPELDDESFDEATLSEKEDIEKFFGGFLPYLSASFGVKFEI